jgi:type II secretory pathway pseudopilin PulG
VDHNFKINSRNSAGVTLVEIVLAITVLGIVMASAVKIFGISLDLKEAGERQGESIQTVRVLANRISSELKRATAIGHTAPGYLKFDMLDDQGQINSITYTLSDGIFQRMDSNSVSSVMADNITQFTAGGVKLWSRLGSEYEITNPEIGPGGMIMKTPRFNTVMFDNGIEVRNADDIQVMFPAIQVLNHQKGTIEFWARMEYSSMDSGGFASQKYMIDSAVGPSGEQIELFFSRETRRLVFRMNGSSMTVLEVTPSWDKGGLTHIAVVWDSMGKEIGQSQTMAVYINGVKAGSMMPETTTWEPGRFGGYFCFGSYEGAPAEAYFDNIKIYDYCKTNFNDRFQEEGEGLVWFTISCSQGSNDPGVDSNSQAVSITNSVRIF